MGGPWRDRGFDPTKWRTPPLRVEARIPAPGSGVSDPLTGLVIGYVAAVAAFVGMLPMLLKNGW